MCSYPKSISALSATTIPEIIVAHGPCSDGMMAAAVATHWARLHGAHIEILFANHPLNHETIQRAITGRHTLFVDITPGDKTATTAMISAAKSLFILDHHKTAMDELVGAMTETKTTTSAHWHFDLNKSGATLAWDFFFPGQPIPTMVHFVEQRDLSHLTEDVKLMTARLYDVDLSSLLLPSTLAQYVELVASGVWLTEAMDKERALGRLILKANADMAMAFVKGGKVRLTYERLCGGELHVAYVTCQPRIAEEVALAIRIVYPKVDVIAFVSLVPIDGFSTRFGLRCGHNPGLDVSAIALWLKSTGLAVNGGGHPGAAGATRKGRYSTLTGLESEKQSFAAPESKSGQRKPLTMN